MAHFKETLKHIKAFIFDIDGVFTDGSLYIFPGGELVRRMNIKDGYAVKHAVEKGYIVAIVSGGLSDALKLRFENLGVKEVYLGVENKKPVVEQILKNHNLKPDEIVYMGDDMPDFDIIKFLPVTACPSDAANDIKSSSLYISPYKGGSGCVRDIIEQVLRAQSNWL